MRPPPQEPSTVPQHPLSAEAASSSWGNNLVVPEVFLHPSTILTGMPATQHRGSAGSFLRRGQLLAEGSSCSTDVACRGDEPETLVLAQLGLGPIAAVDVGDHPGGVGGGADPLERLGVGVIQLP